MTARATWELSCDGCEFAYWAPFLSTGSEVAIRLAASKEGWLMRAYGQRSEDLCPQCWPGGTAGGAS